jgi:uncharacterized membrane protein
MSDLVVITFDSEDEAEEVLESLQAEAEGNGIKLDDSAIVVKDVDGEIHVKNALDRGTKVGAVGGGLLGLLIGFVTGGPIGSLLIGAIGGALGGNLANLAIDREFEQEVSEALTPGTSALFIMVRDDDPHETIEALDPYHGQVYYTSLPEDVEEQLEQVMSDEGVTLSDNL